MRYANAEMHALIELAASSGIRIGALIKLRVEDLDFDRDNEILVICVGLSSQRQELDTMH